MTNLLDISCFIAVFTGILSSAHCLGMCGSIILFLTINLKNKNKKLYNYTYNFGRIISYVIIGFLSGFFGILINELAYSNLLLAIKLISEISVINIGLYIIFGSKILIILEKFGFFMWNYLQFYIKFLLPIKNFWQAIIIGIIWGFIPCGIVYNVLIWSISFGSITKSSFLMFMFGCGTLPSMLLTGYYSMLYRNFVNNRLTKSIFGFIFIFIGLIGIYSTFLNKCH